MDHFSKKVKGRSIFYVFLGALLPMLYVIALLVYNYQNNAALQDSSIKRYKLGIENQASILGYYFLERKYDITTMASSLEVNTYFTNKALGMSEEYGLRVSLFSINQMMEKTISEKTINASPIYKRLAFLDQNKKMLVKTESRDGDGGHLYWKRELDTIRDDPELIIEETDNGYDILVVVPCFFKKKNSGWIVSWLDLGSLHHNFLGSSLGISSKVLGLTLADGSTIHFSNRDTTEFSWEHFRGKIAGISNLEMTHVKGFKYGETPLLLTRMQIHKMPLFLTACVKENEITGSIGMWQFLTGAGALVFLILISLFLFVRADTKHLILKARFDEAKKQHDLLTEKNIQLKGEIAKRKEAELFLKENEERYRKLFESSSDAILIIKDGRIIACNQATAALFNSDHEEIIDQAIHAFAPYLQPDGRLSQVECMEKLISTFEEPQSFECTLKGRNDKLIDAEINMTALALETGRYIQLIIRDITEKKQTQEILIQTEKMMAVGGLAAGMAHEINNPLGIILQANQGIERRLGTSLKKNYEVALSLGLDLDQLKIYLEKRSILKYIESIQVAGERAAIIVRSMLDFGRAGNTANKQQCHVSEIMDSAIEMASKDYDLKKKFDFRNIKINRSYSDTQNIMIEKTEIFQVFLNIVKNAAQAMSENGFHGDKPQIDIFIEQREEKIIIEIADNGPGISKENQKTIFEPFFTTKAVGEGTGLGLSVSYFIVTTHHKGNLYVESQENAGARFIIELPVK